MHWGLKAPNGPPAPQAEKILNITCALGPEGTKVHSFSAAGGENLEHHRRSEGPKGHSFSAAGGEKVEHHQSCTLGCGRDAAKCTPSAPQAEKLFNTTCALGPEGPKVPPPSAPQAGKTLNTIRALGPEGPNDF